MRHLKYLLAAAALSGVAAVGFISPKAAGTLRAADTVVHQAPIFLRVPHTGFVAPFYHGDTQFAYLFYDHRDSLTDVQGDFDDIGFISLFKYYNDPYHTYTDADGTKKPLPITKIIMRYDRTDSDKWVRVDYGTNTFTDIRTYEQDILACDTVVRNAQKGDRDTIDIFRYYRTSE